MGKGALAFIAGLGTGYLNQKNREDERARQEKFDQIALDRADRERQDYEKKKEIERSVAEASKPGEIKYENVAHEGVPMLSAQDPLPGEESAQITPKQQPIASQGLGISQADASANIKPPMAPIASQGVGGYTRKVTFNGKEYADESAAKSDIAKYNSPEERNARIVQSYRTNGDHIAALDLEAKAKQSDLTDFQMKVQKHSWGRQLQQEGIDDVAKAIAIGDADGALKAMNSSGQHKAQNLTLTPVVSALPDGSKRTSYVAKYELIRPDGSIQPMQSNSDDLQKVALSVKDAISIDIQKEAEAYRRKHQTDTFNEQKRSNRAHEGIASGSLSLQQKRDEREANSYRRQTPEGQIDFIEKAIGVPFSQEDRRKYLLKAAGLGEKAEDHQKFAQDLVMEQVKGGTLTATQAPDAVQAVLKGFATAKQAQTNEQVIKGELSKVVGKAEYPDLYKEAVARGATPEVLKSWGFEPPAKNAAAPRQSNTMPIALAGIPSVISASNQASAKRQKDQESAEAATKQKEQFTKEIEGITPEHVAALGTTDAKNIYEKYRDVLPSDVANALRNKLMTFSKPGL